MYKILIDRDGKNKEIALLEDGKLVEYYNNEGKNQRKEGNIYIGVVKDILKGMQSAFIDIGTERNSFIHLKDILEKVDETKEKPFDAKKCNDIHIENIVKKGQKLLVQVNKDSNKQKGARVSTHINLPSKYIALMPNTDIITVSQKIKDKKEQERLIKLVKENITKGNGAIIRTSAKGKEKEIISDIKATEKRWQKIKKEFDNYTGTEPKLVVKAPGITEKMLIDFPEESIEKIEVNNKKEYKKLQDFKGVNSYLSDVQIELEEGKNLVEKYGLEKDIEKIENRKIWLKCGGFITIDKTEALTAIDVNTGKYTGSNDVSKTIFKVNKEATIEIAKQIRLRDLGGIIIIDYIDMDNEKQKEEIINIMNEELKKDRTKTQVEGFTKLELLEMTRKHICSHRE